MIFKESNEKHLKQDCCSWSSSWGFSLKRNTKDYKPSQTYHLYTFFPYSLHQVSTMWKQITRYNFRKTGIPLKLPQWGIWKNTTGGILLIRELKAQGQGIAGSKVTVIWKQKRGGSKMKVRKERTISCQCGDDITEQVKTELCSPGEGIWDFILLTTQSHSGNP